MSRPRATAARASPTKRTTERCRAVFSFAATRSLAHVPIVEDSHHRPLGTLADVYLELIQQLEVLCGHARAEEWTVLADAWPHFMAAFEDRMKLEEEVLFPAYAEQGREARLLVKQLVEEHAAMRQLVSETSRQIRRRRMRPITQELLSELLRDHAALETKHLDPWIALDVRDWSLQLRRVPTLP